MLIFLYNKFKIIIKKKAHTSSLYTLESSNDYLIWYLNNNNNKLINNCSINL